MRLPFAVLLIFSLIAGCSKQEESSAIAQMASEKVATDSPSGYMAYQHSIHLDTKESKVVAVYEAVQAACRAAVADQCVVLVSNINTGRDIGAELTLRAKRAGIQKLVAVLSAQGELISQSTMAEDLASPIQDTAKKLAMLNDYRSKLEALRGRASSDVDSLIKVNKELAQVQSEIESISGERAHLLQRVDTEILRVAITSVQHMSLWKPISAALADFSLNLAQGTSSAITAIAYVLPWSVILFVITWISHKLWRRARRSKQHAV